MSSNPGAALSPPDSQLDSLDRLIVAVVRGDAVEARTLAAISTDLFVRRAEWQGLLPLAAVRLDVRADAPAALREACAVRAEPFVTRDAARETALRAMLAAFEEASLRTLLIKGAHLAHTHYERTDLRPRTDTDLLIAAEDRERVFGVLQGLGYRENAQVGGTLVMYQTTYVTQDDGRVIDAMDVHWKIANPQIFADLVSFDELYRQAVRVPSLGAAARVPSDVHALMIACVHRVAHHHDADRLIWLYDIHLLAERLSDEEWRAFAGLCHARSVAQVCWWSLERTIEAFRTVVPADVLRELAGIGASGEQRTAAFLAPDRRHIAQVVGDLRALKSWKDRVRLMGQHLFPSPVYMRSRYAPASSAPLPVLYVRRAMYGAWKWLAKP